MDVTPPTLDTAANGGADVDIIELTASPVTRDEGARRTDAKRAAKPRAAAKRGRAKPRSAKRARTAAPTAGRHTPVRGVGGTSMHRLVARSELGRTNVVSVETPAGRLAVGIANGRPFAVSDTCRHLFASLGEGRVLRDGCLQCPWHRSRYDVTTGKMVRGPQGLLFLSVREIVRAYTNLLFPLKTYPVVERAGVLYLATGA